MLVLGPLERERPGEARRDVGTGKVARDALAEVEEVAVDTEEEVAVNAAVAVCTSTLPRSALICSKPWLVASSAASAAGLSPAVANACSLSRNSLTVASVRVRAFSSSAVGAPPLAMYHDDTTLSF